MSLDHDLGGILGRLEAAEERFHHAMTTAVREAGELSVEALSDDHSVKLTMNGDCRVTSVAIDQRRYERLDADGLSAAVLSAYNRAVIELGRGKRRRIMSTLDPDTEDR